MVANHDANWYNGEAAAMAARIADISTCCFVSKKAVGMLTCIGMIFTFVKAANHNSLSGVAASAALAVAVAYRHRRAPVDSQLHLAQYHR